MDEPLGLTWVKKMKVLGVWFGVVPVEQHNWSSKLTKLEKSINLGKSRSLSFLGKCLIVNVIGLSKFYYLARVLLLPEWVSRRVNQLIWPFYGVRKSKLFLASRVFVVFPREVSASPIFLVNVKHYVFPLL